MKNLLCLLALLTVACAPPVQTLAYTARPDRIAQPEDELRSLILGNTSPGCVTELEYSGPRGVVSFVCTSGGAGNVVVQFNRISGVELQQQGDWYRVRAHHQAGMADFFWDFKVRDDAESAYDAIVALAAKSSAS